MLFELGCLYCMQNESLKALLYDTVLRGTFCACNARFTFKT